MDILEVLLLILSCKTMYWYRKDLPSTSTTPGNVSEVHSIIRSGLNPGGQSPQTRKTIRVLSQQWTRWKMKIVWKNLHATWESQGLFHTKILGNLTRIQYTGAIQNSLRRGELQSYQTRSHAIVIFDTLPAVCNEKVVCMKTKDELYQKGTLDSEGTEGCIKNRTRKLVYKINGEQDARTSCGQPSGSKMPWETGSNTVDYRNFGVLLSTVEQQDTHRKDKVKKLIEKFENHPNKESFLRDFKQTKEINEFSKESQDLIADMNNTEIWLQLILGKQALSTVLAEDAWEDRGMERRSTRATTMSCRYPLRHLEE